MFCYPFGAQDAREAVEKAIKEGKEIPKDPAFDSNTITPGTDFMDRLTAHFKWFLRKKINEDSSWRDIDVIFSGLKKKTFDLEFVHFW
jgi:5'-3' exoribonuclease 1